MLTTICLEVLKFSDISKQAYNIIYNMCNTMSTKQTNRVGCCKETIQNLPRVSNKMERKICHPPT
jgi:hypothetical protein